MKTSQPILFIFIIGLTTMFYLNCHAAKETKNTDHVIKSVMNYPMKYIIERCQKDHDYTNEDMIILEQELKRYLILLILYDERELGRGMYSKDVDNLWHAFILFTKEYAHFCKTCNDRFIHHVPKINKNTTPEQLEEAHKDFQAFVKNYEATFQEEIHPIWFLDMCENGN